jgi:hypothetical protein
LGAGDEDGLQIVTKKPRAAGPILREAFVQNVRMVTAPDAEHRIYFYEASQIQEFCHLLRGSKTNWVQDIQFFMIQPTLLEALVPISRSSPEWQVTYIDNYLYLQVDGTELESNITPVDIWAEYQESLLRVESDSAAG